MLVLVLELAVFAAGHIKWDVDYDMDVDLQDLGLLNTKLGLTSDSAGWNPVFDMDTNNIIDSLDGADVTRHLNFTDSMALVAAGVFVMGDTTYPNMPDTIHVYVDSFWMDKYEITNSKYIQFLNDHRNYYHRFYAPNRNDSLKIDSGAIFTVWTGFDSHPVQGIAWETASAYCTSFGKRLCTSAEWEKAARGNERIKHTWGNQGCDSTKANYQYYLDNECNLSSTEIDSLAQIDGNGALRGTRSIGSYQNASCWGIYDLSGNVSDWVSDWLKADRQYWTLPDSRMNPQGPSSGTMKVARGSAYRGGGDDIPVEFHIGSPNAGSGPIGFRCCY